jgi:hypothetical protein
MQKMNLTGEFRKGWGTLLASFTGLASVLFLTLGKYPVAVSAQPPAEA